MGFPERLKQRREELGMSRLQLALELGVTSSAIGNYETGVSHPKPDILYKIFTILDTDPNYLYQDDLPIESSVKIKAAELKENQLKLKNKLIDQICHAELNTEQLKMLSKIIIAIEEN